MQVIIKKDNLEGSRAAFDIFKNAMANEAKVFGLATGSTPLPLYKEMIASDLDFSNLTSINLDEYVGLSADNSQSYHYFMQKNLFDKKPFKKSYVPDGLAAMKDAKKVSSDYDKIIQENPIDVQLLGLGQNGHIAFNEPGTAFDSLTHEVNLTKNTIKANSRFFSDINEVPTSAVCMGIANIMSAKKIVLLAFGENKADAVQKMIEEPITENVPASILQNHSDVTIILDEKAATKLDNN